MVTLVVRRLLWAVPVLFFVALLTFFLMHQAPGGPFDNNRSRRRVSQETQQALNVYFGLDKPRYVNAERLQAEWLAGTRDPLSLGRAFFDSQFFSYLFQAVQGDLGPSYHQRGKRVQDVLLERWPYSLRLGLFALAITVLVGIPLGVLAGLKQNTWIDYASLVVATVGVAIPTFVTGLLVLMIFGTHLRWISVATSDWNTFTPYIAPGLVLGFASMAFLTRITRSEVIEVRHQLYMRTAAAKGLPGSMILHRYILRNAAIPVVTVLAPACIDLIIGAVITESIFGVPGVGKHFVDAIDQRDYSMIMGTTLVYALLIVLANLVVDISYYLLDPRIRGQG